MKKTVAVGLVVLALIVGFLFIQNVGAQGPMMGRGSWWQPSTWNWGAYCPWNNWGSRSSDYSGYQYQRGYYGRGGCGMMNQGWGPGYRGYGNPSNPPQESPQGR
jgi:hypothetical protein